MRDRKKSAFKRGIAFIMFLAIIWPMAAFAQPITSGSAIIPVTQGAISGGTEVEMVGNITPSIMSVTMPSYITFDLNKSTAQENKVLSPDIKITNNSYQKVTIYASNTYVDLSNVPGVRYALSPSGSAIHATVGALQIDSDEIAIGMCETSPTISGLTISSLSYTSWLNVGYESAPIVEVPANGYAAVQVVGTLGADVPENRSFRVVPTFIATYNL